MLSKRAITIEDHPSGFHALSQVVGGMVAILGEVIDSFCARLKEGQIPEVTPVFWMITILAATLGETGSDALSLTLDLGYLASGLIFLAVFLAALTAQLFWKRYDPAFYWTTVLAVTALGVTISDCLHYAVGLAYIQSSALLLWIVLLLLVAWRRSTGAVEFGNISSPKNKAFYWLTILAASSLGTAVGDFIATTPGLGFRRGAILFSGLIACIAALQFFASLFRASLFWTAYILIRPLGEALGDLLTKTHSEGGMEMGTTTSSLAILAGIIVAIALTYRRWQRARVG
jgi:uncharacterized membrane-anchored protein